MKVQRYRHKNYSPDKKRNSEEIHHHHHHHQQQHYPSTSGSLKHRSDTVPKNVPAHNTYEECSSILKQRHHQIRETASPQQEIDMKPANQTVISAAQENRKKKTAPKGV
jgi:hypothetical protein